MDLGLGMSENGKMIRSLVAILCHINIFEQENEVPKHEVASLFSDSPTYHRYHLHGYSCPDVVEDHFSICGSPLPKKMGLGPLRASHPTR